MHIKNLVGLPVQILADCLNLAFADYIIPLYISSNNLGRKIIRENIDLEWSVGLFDGENLVGLILHGIGQREGQKVLYNGGTGILPQYRGQAYTQRMYQSLIPKMISQGVQAVFLEVIDVNERAIKVYRKLDFQELRTVECFRSEISKTQPIPRWPHIIIEEVEEPSWEELSSFFDFPPTWQNDLPALKNSLPQSTIIAARQGQQYLGYLIYSAHDFRLNILAIHPLFRRRGIGSTLIHQLPTGSWSILNIDQRNKSAIALLRKMNWEKTIRQYEMKWKIDGLNTL